MILNRLGNKARISDKIVKHFPTHKTFVDMFFGAGGIFFNKPLAQYNFCNDVDDDVFNLYTVLKGNKEELINELEIMPMTENLLKHWKRNKETQPVLKAVRFLMLSNFGYMGKPETMCYGQSYGNQKKSTLSKIEGTFKRIKHAQFMCCDFRKVISKIQFRDNEQDAFFYADPPYLGTDDNYSHSFTEADSLDLFNCLEETGCKYAMSEFDHPFILQQAKERNLNVVYIGERQNLKNRRTEILVMNYNQVPTLFQ